MQLSWTMMRLPREVHAGLVAFAERISAKDKGRKRVTYRAFKGEGYQSVKEFMPLHAALAELLRREEAHRARGKKKKVS